MEISRQEWADWLHSPVTQAVVAKLAERRDDALNHLLNLNAETVEAYGIHHIATRNLVSGIGQFLDLDDLREWVVTEVSDAN